MASVSRSGKWRVRPSAKAPILIRDIINSGFDKAVAQAANLKNSIVNRVYLNRIMYWPAKEYDAFEAEIFSHLKKDDGWFERFYRHELKIAENLIKHGQKLQKIDWPKKSNEEIKHYLDELLKIYRTVITNAYTQYVFDDYFEEALEKGLAKYVSPSDPRFRHLLFVFTDPAKVTDVAEERGKLVRLAQKFKKRHEKLSILSASAKRDIQRHLDRYGYIARGLGTGKPYTEKQIKERIKDIWSSKENLKELLKKSTQAGIDSELRTAFNIIKPDKKFKKIVKQSREHTYLHNRRSEAFIFADYWASMKYNEIAKRAKFNTNWIMEVSIAEMLGAVEGRALPSATEIKRRLQNYAMIVRYSKTELITDPNTIKRMEKKYYVKDEKGESLSGRVASAGGIVRGRAKVCFDVKDIAKVKRGDILVAPMTKPDSVPAMERAAAVITDQGGISSHAAIVSRELGVPCIIDTQRATRVIKDNDLVEVNAQTGVITILKRA